MGWEQRGNNSYYYKKEREGSRVKSVYVGRGEIAHMVAQIQSTSPLLDKLARTMKSPEVIKAEKAEAGNLDERERCAQRRAPAVLGSIFAGFLLRASGP